MKICQEKNNPTMATKKNEIIQRTESEPLVRRKAKTTNDSEKDVEQLDKDSSGRGRKGRTVAVQEEEPTVATLLKGRVPVVLEAEKEERIVTPVKTTRGKKVMKEVVEEDTVVGEKPKRGRGKKGEEKEPIEEEESIKKPEETSSQRRRGRKRTEETQETIPSEAPSSVSEDPASPQLKAVSKPKRGAKKGKGAKVRNFFA